MTEQKAQELMDEIATILYPVSACSADDADCAMQTLLQIEDELDSDSDEVWERLEQQLNDAEELAGGQG